MKLNIYAIKDELAEVFSNPFCLNDKTAGRTFQFMAKQRSEEECKDQKVYYIGLYDTETGEIIADGKVPVYDLEAEWRKAHEA